MGIEYKKCGDQRMMEETTEFEKQILVGYTKPTTYDQKRHKVFLKATIKKMVRDRKKTTDLKPIKNYKTFSISGHSKDFGGQIRDELNPKYIDFSIPQKRVGSIKNVWKEWHLNDLQAGTKRQQKALKTMRKSKKMDYYDSSVKHLKKKKLHKDRGYAFGSDWLVDPLPKDVELKIKELFKT